MKTHVEVEIPEGYDVVGFGQMQAGDYYINPVGCIAYANASSGTYGIRLRKTERTPDVCHSLTAFYRVTKLPNIVSVVKLLCDITRLNRKDPKQFDALADMSLLELKELCKRAQERAK